MANKRYYWLKLKEDFFRQKEIKKLRRIAGGDTFTIIYLKMLLMSLKNDGRLYYDGIEDDFVSELALDIDEDDYNVKMTVGYLLSSGILVQNNSDEFEILTAKEMTGSECESAQRVRRMRLQSPQLELPKPMPKSNAERQRAFRAKKNTEKQQHIPMIEDYMNQKRYGGNYYLVCQRERFKCAICESTENLCVHHIDGYSENKPQNNATNKMVLVCRECHSKIHAGTPIPQIVLDCIGYDIDDSNDSNVTCNTEKREKKKDIDIEKEKEKELICADAQIQPTAKPKKQKPEKHKYGSFSNVLLTDDEYNKLKEQFTDADERIENLSFGIASKGYQYKNHYATILAWARNDNKRAIQQQKKQSSFIDYAEIGRQMDLERMRANEVVTI